MKRILIAVLSLIPLFAMAQEPQIIGGYLLDGKDSFAEDLLPLLLRGLQHWREVPGDAGGDQVGSRRCRRSGRGRLVVSIR